MPANASLIPILLVDDDTELASSLATALAVDGFSVSAVHDPASGIREALSQRFELILLDVMLPGGDGRKILRRIRMNSNIPIIMLTARGDEADRIAGLESGADDYLPKPFNVRELIARIRSVLSRKGNLESASVVKIGDLEVHLKNRVVTRNTQPIDLTGAEFDILLLLMRSAGQVLSRDDIAEVALGRPIGALDRSIDNHISNLRKKLGARIGKVERIQNVRGTGYVYSGESIGKRK